MIEPYAIEKGSARLTLKETKWGVYLSVWYGSGATSIELKPGERLALAKALCDSARKR